MNVRSGVYYFKENRIIVRSCTKQRDSRENKPFSLQQMSWCNYFTHSVVSTVVNDYLSLILLHECYTFSACVQNHSTFQFIRNI